MRLHNFVRARWRQILWAKSFDSDSAAADSQAMKANTDLHLHLLTTMRVVGRHVDSLKGVVADMPKPNQGIASTVIAQLKDTLIVVEAAWSCANAGSVDEPATAPKLLLN
jgi:hypothetical protein